MFRRSTLLCLCLATVAAVGGPLAAHAAVEAHPLSTPDFDRIAHVSEPRVSPDGAWVAYVLTTEDPQADEERSALWMVSWDGSQRIELTRPVNGASKPRWSPDGRFISFLAAPAGSDKTQLMVLDRRGGESRTLTNVSGDLSDYAWSPDGKRVVVVLEQPEEAAQRAADKTPKPIVIEALHFKDDEGGYLAAGRGRHLYLVDVASGELGPLTADTRYNESTPAWSPDGTRIAYVRTHERGADSDGKVELATVEAHTGAAPQAVGRVYASNQQVLSFTPDGRSIVFLQGAEPRFTAYMQDHLFVVPAAGGTPRPLAPGLDRAVASYVLAPGSGDFTVAVEDDRSTYPAHIAAGGGAAERVGPAGEFVVGELTSGAGHVAMVRADDHSFAEVYALEGAQARKLTGHNDALLAELKLGAVEDVSFKSSGGAEIHGLMVKPPDFVPGRTYPLLLWIHGGPNGQDDHALAVDGYQFEPQYFAGRGFVVLRVNYRGSSGRGGAFARAILADWGHKEVEDLLAGVDDAVKRGIADPKRLYIGGWSYGGILTDYTIASDRRFRAAISGAGSANQLAFFGTDEYITQYNAELGPPWRDTALWLKVSYPYFHADRIHTPTLFLGGDKDFNVPIIGGEQMYQALKILGVPAQLAIYPDQHHVFTRPSFVRDLAERMTAWLDR